MPTFSTAELRAFNELPLRKRRQIVELCAMLETNEPEEPRTAHPKPTQEGERVRGEDEMAGETLLRLRAKQSRSGRPPKRKNLTLGQAAAYNGSHLSVVNGSFVPPDDQQHDQGIPEG